MRSLATVAIAMAVGVGTACGAGSPDVDAPGASGTVVVTLGPPAGTSLPSSESGLPVHALTELPPEAAAAWALVEQNGPFPYRSDGEVFHNREGLLPDREPGYYREYTVDTPGEVDRGARRLVVGAGGELYYTADHYASFVLVDPAR